MSTIWGAYHLCGFPGFLRKSGLRQPKSPKIWDFLFYIDIVCLNNYWMLLGIVLIEKDLHHQIIMITMSLDEKLRKYMIEFMKITVFD